MAQRQGLFSRIVQNITRSWKVRQHEQTVPKVLIGRDEFGNRYYEQEGMIAGKSI